MRFILSCLMLLAMLWSGALLWFVETMPRESAPASMKTEAIVVLTGGQGRVEHGLEMLAQGAAPLLYITGVGEHVTTEQILEEHASPSARGTIYHADVDIVLDHVARSTVSNADQSAAFLHARGIKTIRLITANYHMKRSMHEFKTAIPEITILADAVFPEDFKRDEWWQHPNTRRLVFSEFYKYGAVVLRDWLKPSTAEKA